MTRSSLSKAFVKLLFPTFGLPIKLNLKMSSFGNVIFSLAAVGWITFLGIEVYQSNKKIDLLNKEIEELKNKEGE